MQSYKVDVPAGADSVVEANPALVVRVLAPCQDVLVALVVGSLVDHPGAALHPSRVAATQVGVEVGAVPVALISATLVVPVLVEDDLEGKLQEQFRLKRIIKGLQEKGRKGSLEIFDTVAEIYFIFISCYTDIKG